MEMNTAETSFFKTTSCSPIEKTAETNQSRTTSIHVPETTYLTFTESGNPYYLMSGSDQLVE